MTAKEELKHRMIGAIATYPNALIVSIAEKCADVAIKFYDERNFHCFDQYALDTEQCKVQCETCKQKAIK